MGHVYVRFIIRLLRRMVFVGRFVEMGSWSMELGKDVMMGIVWEMMDVRVRVRFKVGLVVIICRRLAYV